MTRFHFLRLLGITAAAAFALAACAPYETVTTERVTTTTSTVPAAPVLVADNADAVFAALDTNRDGFLSRSEASVLMNAVPSSPPFYSYFDTLDTNRDGFLSRAEAEPLVRSTRYTSGRWIIAPWPPAGVTLLPYTGGTVYGPR